MKCTKYLLLYHKERCIKFPTIGKNKTLINFYLSVLLKPVLVLHIILPHAVNGTCTTCRGTVKETKCLWVRLFLCVSIVCVSLIHVSVCVHRCVCRCVSMCRRVCVCLWIGRSVCVYGSVCLTLSVAPRVYGSPGVREFVCVYDLCVYDLCIYDPRVCVCVLGSVYLCVSMGLCVYLSVVVCFPICVRA